MKMELKWMWLRCYLVLIVIAHNVNMLLTASSMDCLGFAYLNHVWLCDASVLHLSSLWTTWNFCFNTMLFWATWPSVNLCICLFHVSLECRSSTWFQYNSMCNDMILIYSTAIQVIKKVYFFVIIVKMKAQNWKRNLR